MNYLEQYLDKKIVIKYNNIDEFVDLINFLVSKNIQVFDEVYTIESLLYLATCNIIRQRNLLIYSKKDKFHFTDNTYQNLPIIEFCELFKDYQDKSLLKIQKNLMLWFIY